MVVYNTKIQGRSRIRRTHNYTWHRRQKQLNPIVTVGNKIPKAVRSDKAKFRTGNWGEQGCLSMLGINHSTYRTSITFCHKLLVLSYLIYPIRRQVLLLVSVYQSHSPPKSFGAPHPTPSPLPPLNLEKKRSGAVLCRILQTENNNECMQISS